MMMLMFVATAFIAWIYTRSTVVVRYALSLFPAIRQKFFFVVTDLSTSVGRLGANGRIVIETGVMAL
jgi:hypothetical protein